MMLFTISHIMMYIVFLCFLFKTLSIKLRLILFVWQTFSLFRILNLHIAIIVKRWLFVDAGPIFNLLWCNLLNLHVFYDLAKETNMFISFFMSIRMDRKIILNIFLSINQLLIINWMNLCLNIVIMCSNYIISIWFGHEKVE